MLCLGTYITVGFSLMLSIDYLTNCILELYICTAVHLFKELFIQETEKPEISTFKC